ncbi:MAG: DNA gyrase C-terminal beta-propeller domain-containing protein, partial [Eubacteriales bacterium]|nr:DNA gyrase C-terminal beta-propeller domain-containing protein [Eubacteriales bacterium]
WGDKRRTKIVRDEGELDDEDLVENEMVAVTLTHRGYIKRVPADTYKAQRRGGKGITGLTTRENDFVKDLIMTNTHDYLMFFTSTGKSYKLKAYEIPEASRTARGTPANNFLSLSQREKITAVIPVESFDEDRYLIAVTKNGVIKKTALSNFNTKRTNGVIAINLQENDELIDIKESTGKNNVIIVTRKGKCICFSEEDVRPMGRIAGGVRAIKLEDDDEVVSMSLVESGQKLFVVTENGYGKRTPVKSYKTQARGGKGLLTYDKTKFSKTGYLVGAMVVDDDDEILLINSEGTIIRIKASDVSTAGRATQGVKIMKVEEGTKIVSMAKTIREDSLSDDDNPKKAPDGEQMTLN